MLVSTTIELTAKEERFVYALGYGLPPTRAAKVAGWAVGSASRLIHKPHIRAGQGVPQTNLSSLAGISCLSFARQFPNRFRGSPCSSQYSR